METEEQQLEQLKQWWKENGRTVTIGVILGLGSVAGWTGWQAHLNAKAEAASFSYERLINTMALRNYGGAVTQADALIAEHPNSGYSGLAALIGAHSAYKGADRITTKRLLEWAIGNATQPEVRDVARLRLARVLSEDGEHDQALARLDEIDNEHFTTLGQETRGDVLVAKGDVVSARTAYEGALADESLNQSVRDRLQLKLDDLAGSES